MSAMPDQVKGIVIQSSGRLCRVRDASGNMYACTVRGKFRIQGLNTTNPVAVGDHVLVQLPEQGELCTIEEIFPRRNYILRKAIAHATRVHMLCANVDQAILVFTVDYPATSFGFADRFLLVAAAYEIPAVVVINKIDLLETPEHHERLETARHIYQQAGYPVYEVCAADLSFQAQMVALLAGKVSFMGGHSGVGKSTLINLVDPDLDLRTAEISDYHSKGRHTTTHAEMFPLSLGGYIIDSPGIKELGISTQFEPFEISHFYPDLARYVHDCRFNTCLHVKEPGCAVRAGVEAGELPLSRYKSYLSILEEIQEETRYS